MLQFFLYHKVKDKFQTKGHSSSNMLIHET